jgi:hypothetical protein
VADIAPTSLRTPRNLSCLVQSVGRGGRKQAITSNHMFHLLLTVLGLNMDRYGPNQLDTMIDLDGGGVSINPGARETS